MGETLHDIELIVPLSGSALFDINARATAHNLCARFPGLKYEVDSEKRAIRLYGQLNDYWYKDWQQTVFHMAD